MKVASLISGGKDSIYATYIAMQYGWDISYLVTIVPKNKDSWMFHGVNLQITPIIAKSMEISLIKKESNGLKEVELDDLKSALEGLDIDGVISGAVASDYQRSRINHVCDELGLKSFTPLWHKKPENLLRWQIDAGFEILIVSISAEGLEKRWLGKTLNNRNLNEFIEMCRENRVNAVGEGGEFETLVLNCPVYKNRLVVKELKIIWKRDYGWLEILKIIEEDK